MAPKTKTAGKVIQEPPSNEAEVAAEAFKCHIIWLPAHRRERVPELTQVTLASVLARSDQECLLSELEALQTKTEVTLSTKAELHAVCGHLQNVSCLHQPANYCSTAVLNLMVLAAVKRIYSKCCRSCKFKKENGLTFAGCHHV